jgi:dTDP-glucose 4,6-dehydratase
MIKLLITGGNGFIGSNFIRWMLKRHSHYKIINLDKLTYSGGKDNLSDLHSHHNYTFIRGCITDISIVKGICLDGVDAIINFAAETHVDRSIINPKIFVETNINGTYVLLEIARKYNVKKFIQVSTDEVYGSLGETGLFTESSSLKPNSPYSASKASADLLVRAFHETYGMHTNITRCSNNYGPYQYPEKLIPLTIKKAMQNEPIVLYGNGLNVRDWLHVEDHCQAIELVINSGKSGEVYNVGGNNERPNLEIVKMILDEMKSKSEILFGKDRLGHDYRYGIDASKIKSELGWKPDFPFESGIRDTIKWYLDNKVWLDKRDESFITSSSENDRI